MKSMSRLIISVDIFLHTILISANPCTISVLEDGFLVLYEAQPHSNQEERDRHTGGILRVTFEI